MIKNIFYFFIFILISSCSFDDKTGIWKGDSDEKNRLSEIEKRQNQAISTTSVFSSDKIYSEEKKLLTKISLSNPKKTISWNMHALNHQNFLGNIQLSGVDNNFFKKKVGKKKFSRTKYTNSPLIFKNFIYISDDTGSVFKINFDGKVKWKINIYKRIYKNIYKNITFAIFENNMFIADNVGFVYAVDLETGEVIWIKNHGVPLKSKMKVFDNRIFLINQENRLLSFSVTDGSLLWSVRSISSFIKSQQFLSLALSGTGSIIASTSSGDLLKINSDNGNVNWSLNVLESMLAHATDFFESSDIVIYNETIIFSTQESIFSYDLKTGSSNWEKNISSIGTPIIDSGNIFIVTNNGFFVIINFKSGEVISSTNVLKILKRKYQSTDVTGFIMGSGKIYLVTLNGHLIICSASSGQVETYKKIDSKITSSPIINNGKLYIYTASSRILGFK